MSAHSSYKPAPLPFDEALRLEALEHYKLAGVGREPPFDRITQLAADLFSVPIALISIIGADMQCFRGACGLDIMGTSRDVAFCSFAILKDEIMVVPDATKDPRFHNNPLVTGDTHIRFYAGVPLRVGNGQPVGTLCLIDREPRELDEDGRRQLAELARTTVDLIELRVERFAAKEERRKLALQHELLKLTVENVTEGVALVDEQLRLILWNQSFAELFDYSEDLLAEGGDAAALMRLTAERGELGPGDPAMIVKAFVQSIQSTDSGTLELQRCNGTVLDVWRKSISGNRFIMTARDVTAQREMVRLKDELVSTVSHELRTPLTAIAGALGLMASGAAGDLPAKASQLVAIGRRNADRLIGLVNDLLEMDKLQSNKLALQCEETDLRDLVTDAVEQNQPYADRFNVTLSSDLMDQPLLAWVDSKRIMQVFTNLISNACKFSPPDTEVRVTLAREEDRARISISDQGPGISTEFLPRLFKRFSQEDGSHQQGHSGAGLGLAICKGIVDAHGGSIELDRSVEVGATFHIWLPAID